MNNNDLNKNVPDKGNGAVTSTSMSAGNTTECQIIVVPDGTCIPLPSNQVLDGFKANKTNTSFTVPKTGRYGLTYSVSLTSPLQLSTRVLVNGVELPASVLSPANATNNYTLSVFTKLNECDVIELQLFGIHGVAVLQSGSGAALALVRLS